jgi:hypothetical protein
MRAVATPSLAISELAQRKQLTRAVLDRVSVEGLGNLVSTKLWVQHRRSLLDGALRAMTVKNCTKRTITPLRAPIYRHYLHSTWPQSWVGQATPFPCGIKSIDLSLAEATNVGKSRPDLAEASSRFGLWWHVDCG